MEQRGRKVARNENERRLMKEGVNENENHWQMITGRNNNLETVQTRTQSKHGTNTKQELVQ